MFLMLDYVLLHLGVDSFYEYLFKAHILFGKEEFWRMFHSAYIAVQKYFRHGPWYSTTSLSLIQFFIGTLKVLKN